VWYKLPLATATQNPSKPHLKKGGLLGGLRVQNRLAKSGEQKSRAKPAQRVGTKKHPFRLPRVATEGERKPNMSAIAIPIETVQQNMTFVDSGASLSERMHDFRRFISRLLLTVAFYDAVREQRELITMLDDGCVQNLDGGELTHLADRLDGLITTTERVIEKSRRANFALWNDPIITMETQCERLDSIAESFRLSASKSFVGYIDTLMASAEQPEEATKESWRDFVASLQD
jgi:hypothetical protein